MNLTNAKHLTIGGKNAVRLEMDGDLIWKGLPEGYTELDYIETTGTQYIDTEFVPNQDSRAVLELMYIKSSDGAYGSRDTTSSDGFSMRVNSSRWQPQYNDNMRTITDPLPDNEWHSIDHNKNVWSLDGVVKWTATYEEFTAPHSFVLGGIMANKSGVKTFYEGYCRYKSCQLYDNGVLIRDFVPCLAPDGKAGMYDVLNAEFYGNAGTGAFVAGEETT